MSATADDGGTPLLLVLDGDGLVHRAYHGMAGDPRDHDADGRPTWALRGLVTSVAGAAARLRPAAVLVALDSREDPWRRAAWPAYKAHRPEREPDLAEQLDAVPALLAAGGVPFACAPGHEGDDVLASAAELARRAGWRSVLVTSDRDVLAEVDATTSVLRVGDGGVDGATLYSPARVRSAFGVAPGLYRDLAALRGDPSDNLPGVPGVGAKTAARLLAAFGSATAGLDAVDESGPAAVRGIVGAACAARLAAPDVREGVERNLALMRLRRDLPLQDLDAMRLPLDRARLVGALRHKEIRLGPALWALVGEAPPPWEPNGFDKAPKPVPVGTPPPWALGPVPTLGELARQRTGSTAVPAPPARTRPGGRRVVVPQDQLPLF